MKITREEKMFHVLNYSLLLLCGMLCLAPLIHIAALSVSDPHEVTSGHVSLWPVGWSMQSFVKLVEGTNIVRAFGNNVLMTVVGTLCSMGFTVLAAYPLSRTVFKGRKAYTMAILFTMMFNGGLIPTYLLVKSLHLLNTYWSIWIPGLVSVFNMLIMKSFMEEIPRELDEAAKMDGCGEWRYLAQVVLPLSVPVMATLTLFYAVGYWNVFFSVLMYITDANKFNLTVVVQNMVQNSTLLQSLNNFEPQELSAITPEGIKAAAIILLIAPWLLVYPFLQKYFVKGARLGAVKG
ncbi:carbohydrate ABC transporter permease [Paenibacillus aceris]|uniref:Aldouronate transport system permease protein n=1 Tax=Paenibacillus aceris TaxID=869555 RepID=A0ABS4I372_9BACL|nr:carbohydrate ABC transporter permease [Paenibacillus aceris]MBP1965371.1 putative aldouronate transport system permease protein [Paenibacillus aceris]NHW36052.1 carbohydrate ABC transporter permease [Paenibacillus aceris]